jgi:hypothetical protein
MEKGLVCVCVCMRVLGGRYRTISGMMAGFFAIAAFFVGTIAGKVARLLAFLASHLVHILGFLDDIIYPHQTQR